MSDVPGVACCCLNIGVNFGQQARNLADEV